MNLKLHLTIHFLFSLLAGLFGWAVFGMPVASFLGGILGGFFVDLDHWIDYFIAFGFKLDVKSFMRCEQFLKSDKLYLLFHGWEVLAVLSGVAFFVEGGWGQAFAIAFVLGMAFHLVSDVFINHGIGWKGYSLFYRWSQDFLAQKIVSPEQYAKDLVRKELYWSKRK